MEYVKSLDFLGVGAKEIPCIVGKGAPNNNIKAAGLLYMDEDTGDIYKRTASGWIHGLLHNLSGQCQTADYRVSVIALCVAPTTATEWSWSYSSGTVHFSRANNLATPTTINVSMGGAHGAIDKIRCAYSVNAKYSILRPCVFTYNGVRYGGLLVQIASASMPIVHFTGIGSFKVFALDVYEDRDGVVTVIDDEVYNSLSYDTVSIDGFSNFISGARTNGYTANPNLTADATPQFRNIVLTDDASKVDISTLAIGDIVFVKEAVTG